MTWMMPPARELYGLGTPFPHLSYSPYQRSSPERSAADMLLWWERYLNQDDWNHSLAWRDGSSNQEVSYGSIGWQ